MAKAFLVVRATVADPAMRAAFDDWYAREHLRDAVRDLRAEKGWRCWSRTEPAAHQAAYQFADAETAERALASDAMKALAAEFERVFPNVTRKREILVLAGEIDGAA